jgi:hypothetical protein
VTLFSTMIFRAIRAFLTPSALLEVLGASLCL